MTTTRTTKDNIVSLLRAKNGAEEIIHVKQKAGRAVRKVIEVSPYVSYDVRLDAPEDYYIEKSDLVLNPYSLWHKEAEPFYRLASAHSSTQYASIAGKLERDSDGARKRLTPFGVDVPSVDIDWAGFESEPDERNEDANYVFCAVPSTPLQGRPFRISVRNEKGRLAKDPVKLSWDAPTLKVYRTDTTQVANGAEFELTGGTMTLHAVPSSATTTFTITAQGPDGESGRTSDQILGWTNPGIGTQTIAQQPVDRTRKTIGIGEEVQLFATGNVTPVTWDASGEVLSAKTGSNVLLTAPEVPCVLVVIANFDNRDFRVVFQVIKPTGIRFQYDSTVFTTLPDQAKCYGLSTKNNVYIAPDTVNFYQLRFCESESEVLGLTGTYKSEKLGKHLKNGPHSTTGVVLPGFGSQLNLQDYLAGRSPSVPFVGNGSYYWLITWSYTVGKEGTANYKLEDVEQRFDFKVYNSATGKFTISKKNVSAWVEGTSSQLKHN